MKNVTGAVEQRGNLDTSGAEEASFSEAGKGILFGLLSNMYSNKFLAVLREYCANARDSHVEAGQTRPIEVTLPSEMQNTLVIQDFGLGMTAAEVKKYFLQYGESSKRDSNDAIGAFGIGSKSAFTMGHQFLVTAVKDGVKTEALLALNPLNVPVCTIRREVETTEGNGLTVQFAVEDVDSMRENASKFFSYWERGSVLVDGEEPTPIFEGATKVNEVSFIQEDHDGEVIVSMGGVPYTAGRDILRTLARVMVKAESPAAEQAQELVDWYSDSSLILKVEIGDVDIAPNREALRDTDHTLATLQQALEGLVGDLVASVQAKVDTARNPFEARLVLERALDALHPFKVSRKEITFGGERLKKEVETPFSFLYLTSKGWTRRGQSSVMVVREEDKYTVDHIRAPKTVVVTGVPEADRGKVKRYAKRFLEDYTVPTDEEGVSHRFEYIVPVEEAQGSHEWFVWGEEGAVHTLTLDEYRAVLRSLRDSNPRTKSEPSYTTGWHKAERDLDERDLLTDILSWGKDIVIYQESAAYEDALTRKALEDYTPVVLLATQSEDALRKRVADDGSVAILDDYSEVVKAYARKVFESVTTDERAALGAIRWLDSHNRYDWRKVSGTFEAEEITSKTYHEVMDAFDLAELVAEDITEERKRVLALVTRHIGKEIDIPEFEVEIPNPAETWPLLWSVLEYNSYALRRNAAAKAQALALLNAA